MNKRKHTDAEIIAPGVIVDLPVENGMEPMSTLALINMNPNIRAATVSPQLHTPDHINCPACWESNVALQAVDVDLKNLTFSRAAQWWILLRQQSTTLKGRTHETNLGYLRSLERFFGGLTLRSISPGHVRSYQVARLHNLVRIQDREVHPWRNPAGNSIINHEISVLAQMLTHCKLWHNIKPFYFPLSTPGWSPRQILTEEQEADLWAIAQNHPEAKLAYWAALITNNTTAAGIELRGLRLKNLFINDGQVTDIYIPADSVKNNSRPRKIALNPSGQWAVGECLKRAIKLGSRLPDHYLFPLRLRNHKYDPSQPATRWFLRNSWNKLRKVTGFYDLNPHDLRHHCITRLLENDVSPETVRAIAGHVTVKMMEYYAHHRRRVVHAATMRIESPGSHPLLK
jgi:integrase